MSSKVHSDIIEDNKKRMKRLPHYIGDFFYTNTKYSPNTINNYLLVYESFLNWLINDGGYFNGEVKDFPYTVLDNLTTLDISAYQHYLHHERGLTDNSINNYMAALKSLFKWLAKKSENPDNDMKPYLTKNVMDKIDLKVIKETSEYRVERVRSKILRDHEIQDFKEFVAVRYPQMIANNKKLLQGYEQNKERDIAIISLVLGSGIRLSELIGIDLDDIDKTNNIILVTRKGNKKDAVPFSDSAKSDLEDYLAIRELKYNVSKSEKAVFLSASMAGRESQRIKKRTVQYMIEKYAVAYGKPSLTMHSLRHTLGTDLYEKSGHDLMMVKEQLGHSSIKTTEIYTHINDDKRREIIKNL